MEKGSEHNGERKRPTFLPFEAGEWSLFNSKSILVQFRGQLSLFDDSHFEMANSTNGISTDITIRDKKLETFRSFKYLGATVSDEGSRPEVLSRVVQTTAAVTKLKVIWNDRNIAMSPKIRLMSSLAIFECM